MSEMTSSKLKTERHLCEMFLCGNIAFLSFQHFFLSEILETLTCLKTVDTEVSVVLAHCAVHEGGILSQHF